MPVDKFMRAHLKAYDAFLNDAFVVLGIRLTQIPAMTSNPLVESYELRGAIVECN
jgi:hypothetical protein